MRVIFFFAVSAAVLYGQSGCADVPGWSAWFSFEQAEFRRLAGPGKVGKGLQFDGKTQYWEFPASTAGVNVGAKNFTIETWVRTTESGTRNFVDKRSALPLGYALFVHQGFAGFQIAVGEHSNYWSRTLKVNDGKWHHVAGVAKRLPPAHPELFVDGVKRGVDSRNTPLDNLDVAELLWLGRHHANGRVPGDAYFAGGVDELTFYPRALTAKEIAAIYRAGSKGKCKPAQR